MSERPRWIPQLGVGGVLLSGALLFPSDSQTPNRAPQVVDFPNVAIVNPIVEPTQVLEPESEILIKDKAPRCSMLFADGLGGRGHKSRDFFSPIAEMADLYGVTYESVLPASPDDPEKTEWTGTFISKIEREVRDGKKVILLGYSMGAREVLELLDALIDPDKHTYNLVLLSHIAGVYLAGARDNEMKNSKNHPELENYDEHYETKSSGKSRVSISPENIERIKSSFGDKTVIFGQPGDTITPEAQGKRLALQIGATYISIDVKNSNGQPDNHFTTMNAGFPIAHSLEAIFLKESCTNP